MYSPWTGIVEFGDVTRHYAKQFREMGGSLFLNFEVSGFHHSTEGVPGCTDSDTNTYPVTIQAADGRVRKYLYKKYKYINNLTVYPLLIPKLNFF